MNKGIFVALAVIIIVWVAVTVTFHKQTEQQVQINQIQTHVSKQDSVIHSLVRINSNLEKTLLKKDSLLIQQKIANAQLERANDSLSVIMRFLERSNLSERYGTK